jgi:activating signal cointegrator complex subunit 2
VKGKERDHARTKYMYRIDAMESLLTKYSQRLRRDRVMTLILPSYPSARRRDGLSPAQLSQLNKSIALALRQCIALPDARQDLSSWKKFVTSYSHDAAFHSLQSLIWGKDLSKDEGVIRWRTLQLCEKIAGRIEFSIEMLLDIAIVYARTNISRTRAIFKSATAINSQSIVSSIAADVVPAFTSLLVGEGQGLYGLRKAAFCVSSFLHSCTEEMTKPFYKSKEFVLALASVYDGGLSDIARTYGGVDHLRTRQDGGTELDEWEGLWLETKVSLIDSFHIVMSALLRDMGHATGQSLLTISEVAFDLLFALLGVSSSSQNENGPHTAFLDQTLLADYQHSYNFSELLATAMQSETLSTEKDARLDILESTLKSLDSGVAGPGALKLLILSSGLPLETQKNSGTKGKGKMTEPMVVSPHSFDDPSLDMKVTQVLDIFPDQDVEYIKGLLSSPTLDCRGDPEKVIAGLLEGTVPSPDEIRSQKQSRQQVPSPRKPMEERRNIFDDEELNITQLRMGKKK